MQFHGGKGEISLYGDAVSNEYLPLNRQLTKEKIAQINDLNSN